MPSYQKQQEPVIETRIVSAIRRIIRAVDMHSHWLVEEFGLTGPQLATLKAAAQLGPVSASDLAKAAHIGKPTLTGILDRLEQHELIHRQRSPHDRRVVAISVTDKGKEMLDSAPSLLNDNFRSKLNELEDWEQCMILATLQRIVSMMDIETIESAPSLARKNIEDNSKSQHIKQYLSAGQFKIPASRTAHEHGKNT